MRTVFTISAVVLLAFGAGPLGGVEPWIRHAGFTDFSAGTLGDGGSNLYVSPRGVETIHRWDFNLDGHLDLFVGQDHNPVENEDVLVYWGRTDGFRSLLPPIPDMQPLGRLLREIRAREKGVTRLPSDGGGRSLLVDLNGDGWLELVFCNFIHNYSVYMNALIYWGSADGYRADRRTMLPTLLADGLTAADFNRDGFVDLAFSNRGIEGGERFGFDMHLESYVYWNGPTGFSEDRRTSLPTISAIDCASGDLDGDGWAELLFVNNNSQEKSYYLYRGGQEGFSAERRQVWKRGDPIGVKLVDLDRDGRLDLIANHRNNRAEIFRGDGRGFESTPWKTLSTLGAAECRWADFNKDGFLDLVFPNPRRAAQQVSFVYFGAADDGFSEARRVELPTLAATDAAAADFNGDGWTDLAFANEKDNRTYDINSYIYWNGPEGFHPAARSDVQGFGTVGAQAADLDHDGRADLVLVSRNSGAVSSSPGPGAGTGLDSLIYWGNPRHRYSPASMSRIQTAGEAIPTIADLDGNGYPDIALPNGWIYWGGAEGYSPARRADLQVEDGHGTAVGDFNRDGWLDLVATAGRAQSAESPSHAFVFWGSAQGYAADRKLELPLRTRVSLSASTADLNKDGFLDLVVSDVDSDAVDLFWGDAKGLDPARRTGLQIQSSATVEIADLNADGWLDLILGGGWDRKAFGRPTKHASLVWGGAAGFSPDRVTRLEAFDALEQAVADLNRDGFLDIVLTNYHAYTTRTIPAFIYWGSTQGYSTARRATLPAESSSALTVADLNGDGWQDLVVFNHLDRGDHSIGANLFWGSSEGFSYARRDWIPTFGPHFGVRRDIGNIYDRKLREEYISPALECPAGKHPARLSWRARTPKGTAVKFQIRSGATREELGRGAWRGPAGATSYFDAAAPLEVEGAHRWLQYKALIVTADGGGSPVLEQVEIEAR